MKSNDGVESRLAWAIFEALEKLNDLLWDRYGDEFLDFHMEDQKRAEPAEPIPEEP